MSGRKAMLAPLILMLMSSSAAWAQFEVGGILDIVGRNRSSADYSNKTFKQYSNFDFIRTRIFFDAKVSDKTTVFTQLLIDNDRFHMYGAYARLNRIGGKNMNLNVGFIPNTVGIWGPRTYSDKNPLIGVPLVYIYHTALNPSSSQITKEQLLAQRGLGYARYGWPILYDACWNTGIDLFGSVGRFDWSLAAISGTLSAPTIQPEKDIPQVTTKLTYYPSAAVAVTLSAYTGPYLTEVPQPEPPVEGYRSPAYEQEGKNADDYLNLGAGLGLHYDYGYLEAFAEGFWTRWEHPYYGNLDAYSGYADIRYKFATQWYLAGRIETIRFSELDFGGETGTANWDYPLNRFEFGIGHHLDNSTSVKAVSQIVRCPQFKALNDESIAIQLSIAIR